MLIAFQAPAAPVDPAVYLSFFQEALQQTSIHDTLGITPEEAPLVVQTAALCKDDVQVLDARMGSLVFESRMEAVENGSPSEQTAARIKALEAQRVSVILRYVEQMKASLGGDVFKRVDDYVRAHANRSFFPVGPQMMKKL